MTIDELFIEAERLCDNEDKMPDDMKPYAMMYETKNIQIKIKKKKTSYTKLLEEIKTLKRYKLLQEAGDIKGYGKLYIYIDDCEIDSIESAYITSTRNLKSESGQYLVTLQSGTQYPFVKLKQLDISHISQIYPFIYPPLESKKPINTIKLVNEISDRVFVSIMKKSDEELFEEICLDLDKIYQSEDTMVETFKYFYPKILMLPDKRELKNLPRSFPIYVINCP